MEFLMTYGWAILVVLAAIGALAYFGILSPSKFLPSSCTMSGGFSCTQYKVTSSGVQVGIQNNLGADVDSVEVTLSGDCSDGPLSFANIANGESVNGASLVSFNCTPSGSKFKGTVTVVYVKAGEALNHTATGTIQSSVET